MKHSILLMLAFMPIFISGASSCSKDDISPNSDNNNMANGKIKIWVNSKTFTATLWDNNAAKAGSSRNLQIG